MNKRYIFIGIVCIFIIITSIYAVQHTLFSTVPRLQLQGNVEVRYVPLSFRVAGRIKTLHVDEGDAVTAGQIVAELDNTPYHLKAQESLAIQDAKQAELALMQQGSREEAIAQAKARVNAVTARLSIAQLTLKRHQALVPTGASQQSLADEAMTQVAANEAELEIAQAALALTEKPYRSVDFDHAAAALDQAKSLYAQSLLQVEDSFLKAPSDGIILSRLMEPGSMAGVGTPVFTLTLTEPVWIRAYAEAPFLAEIVPGKTVKIWRDGRAEPYTGIIGFVSSSAEFTPKQVETQALRTHLVYRFRIIVKDADEGLRQGMPVTISIDSP